MSGHSKWANIKHKKAKEDVPIECAMQRTKEIVAELYARINSHVPESI